MNFIQNYVNTATLLPRQANANFDDVLSCANDWDNSGLLTPAPPTEGSSKRDLF